VLTPAPIEIREGSLIDYRLRLHGVPIRWQSEITAWQPPFRFVDEQRRGPYRRWRHEHLLVSRDGGTLNQDIVQYDVLGGAFVNRLLVERDLKRIFEFRERKLIELLAGPAALPAG
jgi:ligand-binding SRPBCC domain-containing protein